MQIYLDGVTKRRKRQLQHAEQRAGQEISNLLPELHQKYASGKGKKLGAYFPEDSKECILKNASHTIAEGE